MIIYLEFYINIEILEEYNPLFLLLAVISVIFNLKKQKIIYFTLFLEQL